MSADVATQGKRRCQQMSHVRTHLRSQQLRTQGKGTRNNICLHCLRRTKTSGTDGKTNTPRCAGPAHQQKDAFVSTNRKNGVPREAMSTQGCARVCQFMFAVASQVQPNLFPTCSHDVPSTGLCITLDASRHCISRNAVQLVPTTGVIPLEHRFCERLLKLS